MHALLLVACVDHTGSPFDQDTAPDLPDDTADGVDSADSADSADSGETGDSTPVEPTCPADNGYVAQPDRPAVVFTGAVTWTLEFDADAEAAGFHDCTYTREYGALEETLRRGWLCPECRVLAQGDVVMTSGHDDCYLQIGTSDAEVVEQIGLVDLDGATQFYRSGSENLTLAGLGPIAGTDASFDVSWSDESALDGGGNMVLSAAGHFDSSATGGTLSDPWVPREEPYTGGWPQCNPGGPPPTWLLQTHGTFPNPILADQYDEDVAVWDFLGRWVVIDMSAVNCGPCQVAAEHEHDLVEEMAQDGVVVEVVTLLAEALDAVNIPADLATRQDWAETFALTSPVLGDPGFAYATVPDYLAEDGISFPTFVVVAPDGTIRGAATGFSEEGGWDEVTALIE